MRIIIFDPYKTGNFKINKDQAGGYGTSNEIGSNVFSVILSAFLKKTINYSPMFAVYTYSVLKKKVLMYIILRILMILKTVIYVWLLHQ